MISTKNYGCTLIASLMMMAILAFSMGQTSGFDDNTLLGGREAQFLCFGGSADIAKRLNRVRRYSFTVAENTNISECSTSGGDRGDVDLYICETSDAELCMENPHDYSKTSGRTGKVTTILGAQTWCVIVKANLGP